MKKVKVYIIISIIIILVLLVALFVNILLNKDEETILKETPQIKLGVKSTTDSSNVSIIRNNIYINGGGTYDVKGILNNGTIYIDTNDEIILNLSKVTMVNENDSVINNRASKAVTLNVLDECILSDGSNSSSVITSTGDLTIAGDGSMLIYGNGGNGITTTNGNLTLEIKTIYVTAKESAFYSSDIFSINSGTVIGLGKGIMQIPNNTSKQNTFLFNFNEIKDADTNLSLYKENNSEIIAINTLREFKTLTISSEKLENGKYYLMTNITNDGKLINGIYDGVSQDGRKIYVGNSNIFQISGIANWYGNMNIKRLTLEQNANFT